MTQPIEITLRIPLPGGPRWTAVTLPRQMTDADWTYFLGVLDVMKPGIVTQEPPREAQEGV